MPWIVLVCLLTVSVFIYFRVSSNAELRAHARLDTPSGPVEPREAWLPLVALAGSGSLSFLLFGIMLAQVRGRLRAEQLAQELKLSQAALAGEKNRLSVTLTSIADGVISTGLDGRVVTMNPAAERITGWTQSQAVGQPLEKVFCTVHEKTREPRVCPVGSVLRLGGAMGHEAGTILIARDGTERIIADAASPIRADNDQTCGMVLVFRDITEQRKTEERLLKESKLETIGSLAGGIAHDYNNILTILIGNLSLARAQAGNAQKLETRLNAVEGAALRAKDLTQQLLTFASGGAPIKRPTDLAPLLREAVEFALHGSKVQADVRVADPLWSAEVDEGQLRHALNNLVLHGVRAMSEGGRLELSARNRELRDGEVGDFRRGRYLHIVITDRGGGLGHEELRRIFDPYFSTKQPGGGLGLATAHSIIRKHGGELLARSAPGQGTTFNVYLPALSAEATCAATVERAPTTKPKGARVLIMDDEPGIRESLALLLGLLDVETESVRDGREALQHYEAARAAGRPFAAVIMDLTIPNGMGGKEAVRLVKQMDPGARAIVSSGYSNDPVMAHPGRYGFDGVMPKPYQLPQLERVLCEVLCAQHTRTDDRAADEVPLSP